MDKNGIEPLTPAFSPRRSTAELLVQSWYCVYTPTVLGSGDEASTRPFTARRDLWRKCPLPTSSGWKGGLCVG